MKFTLYLAILLVSLLSFSQNANCQGYYLDEPTPRNLRRFYGKSNSSSPRATNIIARTTPLKYNVPTAVNSTGRQPQKYTKFNQNYTIGTTNQGPRPIPNYPKPNQYPSGLSLSYGLPPAFTTANRSNLIKYNNPTAVNSPGRQPQKYTKYNQGHTIGTTNQEPRQIPNYPKPNQYPSGHSLSYGLSPSFTTANRSNLTKYNDPTAVNSPGRQPQKYTNYNQNNPIGTTNQGPRPIPNYPKPNQYPSGLSLSYGLSPAFTTANRSNLTKYNDPTAVNSPGRQPQKYTKYNQNNPIGTTNQGPRPIPNYPKPNQYPSGHSLSYGLSPAFTTANRSNLIKYNDPTAVNSPGRQPQKYTKYNQNNPFGTTNQGPRPIPNYPKPNQYPSGLDLSYGLSPAFTTAHRSNQTQQICLPQVLPRSPSSSNTSRIPATDDEILQLTESLYIKETNSQLNKIAVHIQGKTRSVDNTDEAPYPLLQVNQIALQTPTIVKMRKLFDNYEMDTSKDECVTSMEQKEEDDFINAVLASNVMRQAMFFLQRKGIVSSDPKTQRDLLKTIWFAQYSRAQGKLGSSGFEHVFLNEVKNGKIMGLHNWVYFNQEERAGRLDYKGYLNKIDLGNKGTVVKARFSHNGRSKPVNSLFIGTSPELELALYTVCFELRPDKICPVSMGGKRFGIQTYSSRYQGHNLIGSAYPII